jgi:hypothetical protein
MNTVLHIRCGVTHLLPAAEQITYAMRAAEGFRTDGGCGRAFDLSNPIALALLYRCVECGRWLCKPCILAHFAESGDHITAATQAAS